MLELTLPALEDYIRRAFGDDAKLLDAGAIGTLDKQGMKRFGYGKPLLVRWEQDGAEREGVLSVMKGDKYGHQYPWDRAGVLWFQFETSARLEGHARPLALGWVDAEGRLSPFTELREFFILNEKLPGHDYFLDLERIRSGGVEPGDLALARSFADWLARVHSQTRDDPDLYYRRIRNLMGASECIYGLVDEAYPHPYAPFPDERFMALERRLVDWRWRLKAHAGRLCAVHGDFHPWNVLVDGQGGFRVLDRSRGEWGEAAGDVSTMAANYLLFGLLGGTGLDERFERLYLAYFERYLERTGDADLLRVIAPFFVFRMLVIASPEWYPDHPPRVRAGLLRFMENVLADEVYEWRDPLRYMEL